MMLVALAVVLAGCSDDSFVAPDTNPGAVSPTQLMANFNDVYSEMDIAGYRDLLDDRFLFFFNNGGTLWTKDEDLISTGNMFSGEALTNSDGVLTSAISEIVVDQLLIRGVWEPVLASHSHFGDIPGVQMAVYQIRFVFMHPSGTMTVESDQIFYAVPITADGVTQWSLIGQADVASKSIEHFSWSNIKALFR